MKRDHQPTVGRIIDLVAIGTACDPIVECYESWLEGVEPRQDDLDAARRALVTFVGLPGRIGAAIDAIVNRTAAPSAATLSSLDDLRRVALIARNARLQMETTWALRSALQRLSGGVLTLGKQQPRL